MSRETILIPKMRYEQLLKYEEDSKHPTAKVALNDEKNETVVTQNINSKETLNEDNEMHDFEKQPNTSNFEGEIVQDTKPVEIGRSQNFKRKRKLKAYVKMPLKNMVEKLAKVQTAKKKWLQFPF